MEKDLKVGTRTFVHCPTEELYKKVLEIGDKCGYTWYSNESFLTKDKDWWCFGKDTCVNLVWGVRFPIKEVPADKIIMTAEEFLALHEFDNKKVYYRGVPGRGNEIIGALEELGGITECPKIQEVYADSLYFIDKYGFICEYHNKSLVAWLVQQAFTEAFIPGVSKETLTIEGIEYLREDVENALKDLKPVK